MVNELISKKEELEKKLQDLQSKKETLQQLDTELNMSIIRLQLEIKAIDDRIKDIRSQKKSDDKNNIRNVLGVSFDNHIYVASQDPGNNQMIPKSSSQLQVEYFSLLKQLNEKLDRNEINEEQYDSVYSSLSSLYSQYKEELTLKNVQPNLKDQHSETPYQEPQQYSQPESVDKIDEFEELLRHKYGYYNRSEREKEIIDEMIEKTLHSDIEPVENIERPRGRLM